MKFYISTSGIKRVTVSGAVVEGAGCGGVWQEMKGKHSPAVGRRLSQRAAMLPALVLIGLVLPVLFVRTAVLVLESTALCSSSVGCVAWRYFGGRETLLREEVTRALLEAITSNDEGGGVGVRTGLEGSNLEPVAFKDLVKDLASNRQDIKAFAFKTKAMIAKMEHIVKAAKWRESVYWHLAARGVPKNLHCLSLKLAEEYAVNAAARSRLPPPEYVYRLTDPSFHHFVLLTDNVLAASVVITSTIKMSSNPEKLAFHVVTDKKTYTSMHAWFAVNTVEPSVIEVKGLHQYDWSDEVNNGVKEILEIHHQIWNHSFQDLKNRDFEYEREPDHRLDALSPSCISLLNHLRIYLPELFPDLKKVVLLDDDIVVQQDISSIWNLDLNEKVLGAVVNSWCGSNCCPGRKYKDYFNFSNPIISFNFDGERCGWLYGMNVFDLERWRKSNITAVYHQWLKLNLNSDFALWHPGTLPPALIAFDNHIRPLDPSWHIDGLGHRHHQVDRNKMEAAAVIHFSGPAKPWLEIASPEVRDLWSRHVNSSNEYVRRCGITS